MLVYSPKGKMSNTACFYMKRLKNRTIYDILLMSILLTSSVFLIHKKIFLVDLKEVIYDRQNRGIKPAGTII